MDSMAGILRSGILGHLKASHALIREETTYNTSSRTGRIYPGIDPWTYYYCPQRERWFKSRYPAPPTHKGSQLSRRFHTTSLIQPPFCRTATASEANPGHPMVPGFIMLIYRKNKKTCHNSFTSPSYLL